MNFSKLDVIVQIAFMSCIVLLSAFIAHRLICEPAPAAHVHAPSARVPVVMVNEQPGGQLEQIPATDYLSIPGGIDTGAGDISGRRGSFSSGVTTAGDFTMANGTARAERASSSAPTSVSHGSLSADASNFVGRITGIGSNSTLVLTFSGGGYGSFAHCQFSGIAGTGTGEVGFFINGDGGITAPVIRCAQTIAGGFFTGGNCPDIDYECWGH